MKDTLNVCCFGRYGDVICSSSIINWLSNEYDITFYTTRYYEQLANIVCNANVISVDSDSDFIDKSNFSLPNNIIDLQLGSNENHDAYFNSKLHPLDFLYSKVKIYRNSEIDFYNNFILQTEIECSNEYDVIIAPEAITMPVLDINFVNDIIENVQFQNRSVKVLSKTGNYRNSITASTFVDCIGIIKNCKLFIGSDSGLAWASIYSNCQKHIFHNKQRLQHTNNYYSRINNTFKDFS
jgi:hypothetical protein